MRNKTNSDTKVFFKLRQEDGYPPVAVESMRAKKVSNGVYKIQNIPFYSKEVCLDDIVTINCGYDGEAVFENIKKKSKNSTIRVIFFDKGDEKQDDIVGRLSAMGCSWESEKRFFAVNIPKNTDLNAVLNYLETFNGMEIFDYEYGLLRQ
jgi:hypothetical protein